MDILGVKLGCFINFVIEPPGFQDGKPILNILLQFGSKISTFYGHFSEFCCNSSNRHLNLFHLGDNFICFMDF